MLKTVRTLGVALLGAFLVTGCSSLPEANSEQGDSQWESVHPRVQEKTENTKIIYRSARPSSAVTIPGGNNFYLGSSGGLSGNQFFFKNDRKQLLKKLCSSNEEKNLKCREEVIALKERLILLEKENNSLRNKDGFISLDSAIIPVRSIFFESGDAEVKKTFHPVLKQVVALHKAYPMAKISITGFTDSDGNLKINELISSARSHKVKDYLVENGVDPEVLVLNYKAKSEYLFPNSGSENKSINRRVEILFNIK